VLSLRPLCLALSALVLCSATALAQRRVSGRITDVDTGEPLAGASVVLPGTTTGTVASDSGVFNLLVPEGDASLLVRRIGYVRQTVPAPAGQSEVNVALKRDVLQLEAQIVTGAATSVARRNAANDVARVDADQIARVPTQSVENALQGKIAGAQIIANSGAPGGGNQVRLRGVTSVFGSADPLYVVDGVLVSNDVVQPGTNAISAANRNTSNATNQDNGVNRIADLDPNDIESIEVLKGASASAIYGSKASNGVIIIKTKSGDPGRVRFDLVQRAGTYDLANKFGQRRWTIDEALARYGPAGNGLLTEQEIRDNFASCGGFCDYEEDVFGEHPLSYETSVNLRGGSQTTGTTFFASGINKYDGGIQRNTGYRKQGLRLNLTQAVGSRWTVQLNNSLVRTVTRRGISNNDNANITPYFVFAGTPSFYDLRPKNGVYPENPFTGSNVLQNRDFIRTPEEVNRVISAASVAYSALSTDRQTLQLRFDGGVDRYNQQNNVVSPRFLYFEDNDGLPGTVTSQSANVLSANANLSAIHNWTPGTLSATTSFGVQREISNRRSTNTITRDVILGQENIDRGAATSVFANRQEVRGLAFYAQEEVLALNERMLATVGGRAERSTVNGDIDKFYLFPKASLSYRLPGVAGFVDELKPRFAVGQSGNLPLYIQKYSPAIASTIGGQNALQTGLINGNPNIKPERQTEIEGGIDAALFGSRASLALTVYQKTIDDVILHITTAPSLGYQVDIRNGGTIRNRGTEALLTLTPLQTRGLTWVWRTTFARNVGVVTDLPPSVSCLVSVGLGEVCPKNQRFFNIERDATGQRVAFGSGYGLGRLQVGERVTQIIALDATAGTDAQGNPLVVKKGDAAPDFTLGFSSDLDWRGVRLSFLVDWQRGGDLVNITQNVYDGGGNAPDQPDGGADRAHKNDAEGISQYVYDASFVKLREIAVSYQLPEGLTGQLFGGRASNVRLELAGRNLKTWTDYPGVDPEVSNFGSQQISRFIDLAPFPPTRSFFFTINVGY